MNYTYKPKDYIDQLVLNNELDSMHFSSEDSYEYVISKLEERSKKKRAIGDIANTIIKEYLERYEKDIMALTEEDVILLEEFSELLFPNGKMYTEVKINDFGIFYRLQKILLKHYELKGDKSKTIYTMNRLSLGFMYLVNAHAFIGQESPIHKSCLDLIPLLDSNEIDETAKSKLLILLVRETISSDDHFAQDELKRVFDIIRSHASNEMTLNERFNHFLLCTNILQLFREHCIWAKKHNVKVDIKKYKPFIEETISYMHEMAARIPEVDLRTEVNTCQVTCDYFIGNITLEEMLEKLDEIQNHAYQKNDPIAQARGLCSVNNYYLNILYRFSSLPKDEIIRISRNRIHDILPKLLNISRLVNNVSFNRFIVEFLSAASLTGDFDEFAQIILESTVYADKALFIHTTMVKEMSRAIFDWMIKTNPEAFNGVAGHDKEYIKNHKEEMRELLSDCCMFHDIGKFFMIDIVENSMRKLTDDEFMLIKNHPLHFNDIYQMNDRLDERVSCIRDCALTHHLWHDGTKGYPNIPHTKNRPFVDILAIADSIDAATDFLGRPYNSGKTIDELIMEFKSRAGSQYGKEAIDALLNKEVRDKLEYLITEGRKDIYYHIYAFNKI